MDVLSSFKCSCVLGRREASYRGVNICAIFAFRGWLPLTCGCEPSTGFTSVLNCCVALRTEPVIRHGRWNMPSLFYEFSLTSGCQGGRRGSMARIRGADPQPSKNRVALGPTQLFVYVLSLGAERKERPTRADPQAWGLKSRPGRTRGIETRTKLSEEISESLQ